LLLKNSWVISQKQELPNTGKLRTKGNGGATPLP